MAVVAVAVVNLGQGLVQASWLGMAGGDTGEPVKFGAYPERTVQATGDATDVAVEGSNDNTNWFEMADVGGTTIALDAGTNEIAMIRENPLYLRPVATGGSDTDVIVIASAGRG